MKSIEKKFKNFGYTFFVIFTFLNFYLYYNNGLINYFLITIAFIFLFLTLFKPNLLRLPSLYWEKFGFFLGRFFFLLQFYNFNYSLHINNTTH